MNIRTATALDREPIRRIHLSAFPESEREIVADLAVDLLAHATTPPALSLVAETDRVIGHIAFSPVTIGSGGSLIGSILAPLAVAPEEQRRGIGTHLVNAGIERLAAMGVDLLFVYGNPAYYGRFGFRADTGSRYEPPFPLQHPCGWQALALGNGIGEGAPVPLTCVRALRDPRLW